MSKTPGSPLGRLPLFDLKKQPELYRFRFHVLPSGGGAAAPGTIVKLVTIGLVTTVAGYYAIHTVTSNSFLLFWF